jgi:chitinase
LLTNADQVAKNDTVAWDTAFWFWSANVHSKAGISDGKFGASISAINGALECGAGAVNTVSPKHRFEIYKNVFAAFGLSGSPNEHGCWN